MLKEHSARIGLDISASMFIHGASSVYLAVMDSDGVMKVALCDLDAQHKLSKEHIEAHAALIGGSRLIVIDANRSTEMQRFLHSRFAGIPIYLDAVATDVAVNSKPLIGSFDTVKANRFEAAVLSDVEIPGPGAEGFRGAVEKAAAVLVDKGVRRVIVTLGKEGSYCRTRGESFYTPPIGGPPVNSSGGGDSFMAGIIWGTLEGWPEERTARFASAMAGLTVASRDTVFQEMSVAQVEAALFRSCHE
jgi:pseudouridine kinase